MRNWTEVERQARGALAAEPEKALAKVVLGEALLGQGRYAEGFAMLRHWWDVPELYAKADMDFPYRRWAGEELDGKRFLICSSEGFGDQIMYARFAKLLQARGAEVHWLCPAPLVRLFERCLGVQVIPGVGKVNLGHYDFYSPSQDLPGLFFPPLTEPPAESYLRPPSPSVIAGLTVGVVASGNPAHRNDAHRSLPKAMAEELLAVSGAVDLKPEQTGARDFHDTAQIVAGLDLVISVDTSVAHLAGAMGKPVWILLPAEKTDWRWMTGREDSPWYPTARLFRQTTAGDWRGLVDQVRAALGDHQVAAAGEGVDRVGARGGDRAARG